MPQQQRQGKSGGTKKYGRNLDKCQAYRTGQRRYKNKIRRNRKRLANMPKSTQDRILARIKVHRIDFDRRHGLMPETK